MASPFADPTSPRERLRAELAEKRAEAQAAWKTFDERRQAAIESDADLTKAGSPELGELEEAHRAYERVAEEVKRLEEAFLAALDRETAGASSPVEYGRIPGIAEAFFKTLGTGRELRRS